MKRYVNFVLFFFIFSALSLAEEIRISAKVPKPSSGVGLPKTDQIKSYNIRDDGWQSTNLDIGLPKGGLARYTDNGNNTVTDNATGLMWIKDPSQISGWYDTTLGRGNPAAFPWTKALDKITALNAANYCGRSDWRMPNIKELQSIVNYRIMGPSIDTTFFQTALNENAYYWSSTTDCSSTTYAWVVFFDIGYVEDKAKTTAYYARPVRGGPD